MLSPAGVGGGGGVDWERHPTSMNMYQEKINKIIGPKGNLKILETVKDG